MSKKYFSPKTKGFYHEDHKHVYDAKGKWPTDLIEVTEEQERQIRAAQDGVVGTTQCVSVNSRGELEFYREAPDPAILLEESTRKRDHAISVSLQQITILSGATDPQVVGVPKQEDTALLLQWKKYMQAIRLISPSDENIEWPEQPKLAI